jgi:hypothetical protein
VSDVITAAPWSDEQIAALNRWQRVGRVLPFTCPNDGDDLIAKATGLVCPNCIYTQNWAHAFMLDTPPEIP